MIAPRPRWDGRTGALADSYPSKSAELVPAPASWNRSLQTVGTYRLANSATAELDKFARQGSSRSKSQASSFKNKAKATPGLGFWGTFWSGGGIEEYSFSTFGESYTVLGNCRTRRAWIASYLSCGDPHSAPIAIVRCPLQVVHRKEHGVTPFHSAAQHTAQQLHSPKSCYLVLGV